MYPKPPLASSSLSATSALPCQRRRAIGTGHLAAVHRRGAAGALRQVRHRGLTRRRRRKNRRTRMESRSGGGGEGRAWRSRGVGRGRGRGRGERELLFARLGAVQGDEGEGLLGGSGGAGGRGSFGNLGVVCLLNIFLDPERNPLFFSAYTHQKSGTLHWQRKNGSALSGSRAVLGLSDMTCACPKGTSTIEKHFLLQRKAKGRTVGNHSGCGFPVCADNKPTSPLIPCEGWVLKRFKKAPSEATSVWLPLGVPGGCCVFCLFDFFAT